MSLHVLGNVLGISLAGCGCKVNHCSLRCFTHQHELFRMRQPLFQYYLNHCIHTLETFPLSLKSDSDVCCSSLLVHLYTTIQVREYTVFLSVRLWHSGTLVIVVCSMSEFLFAHDPSLRK